MTDSDTSSTPADDRTEESIDMVTEPAEGDAADLTGSASSATAEQMHGESDAIADEAGVG